MSARIDLCRDLELERHFGNGSHEPEVAPEQMPIHVSETLPLAEAGRAHELLERGDTVGRLVLVV